METLHFRKELRQGLGVNRGARRQSATTLLAVSDFLLTMDGMIEETASFGYLRFSPRERRDAPIRPISGQPSCRNCGSSAGSRRARGGAELPLPGL